MRQYELNDILSALSAIANKLEEIRQLNYELVHKDELAAKRKLEKQATCKHEQKAMMGQMSYEPRIPSYSWLECLVCGKHLSSID